ncbi:ATP-dependent hsl protease ATP-binding subunit hslU [Thraustotheca clavata]|uniref:ATP-dependent hsl protease ATP-binding subunit hslU n=1 Tax=Thraustotheca clavata TaxID=74557 RepID=A0A1V9ZZU9_9STRA|nr:ATP-dependent hsl protease ATP-binding subunit hslU [Thraustotheca clavata]
MLRVSLHRVGRRAFSTAGLTPEVVAPAAHVNIVVEDAADDDLGRKLKPKEVVDQLDKYIIGQNDAKKAVAVALRNRWRRQQLPDHLRPEVSPKNILMIGPTGCGKTEIARRLAKLAQAPFVKVEATKFTEVGFHGRDVDQIIKDLLENSIQLVKKLRMEKVKKDIQHVVEQRIVDALAGQHSGAQSRQSFLNLLRAGEMEDREITIDVRSPASTTTTISMDSSGKLNNSMNELMKAVTGKKLEKKKMTVAEARPVMEEMELENAIDMGDVVKEAISEAEENGIVFIDEIDKICSTGNYRGADASDEGVQRDLLPLIEGSTISTKHGNVNTDHILFIGSGAFHAVKPSNLLAELQGRLPIRVELKALTEHDLWRILTEPVANLVLQQKALMATEKVNLEFDEDAIREIANVAYTINQTIENIGARRLHTVLEKVVEDLSYEASDYPENYTVHVTKEMVQTRVGSMLKKTDLSKFIL